MMFTFGSSFSTKSLSRENDISLPPKDEKNSEARLLRWKLYRSAAFFIREGNLLMKWMKITIQLQITFPFPRYEALKSFSWIHGACLFCTRNYWIRFTDRLENVVINFISFPNGLLLNRCSWRNHEAGVGKVSERLQRRRWREGQ